MLTYTVLKPLRTAEGRTLAVGDTVRMTKRQAKYLIMAGKLKATDEADQPAQPGDPQEE